MTILPQLPIPAIPTLGATTLLTDPGQIIAYVIRQFCTTPRSISTIYQDSVISLGDILSRASNDSTAATQQAQIALTKVFGSIFGNGSINVSVTSEQVTSATYSLLIVVQVNYNNTIYGISNTVQVNNGVLVLENDTVVMPTV